MLKKPLAAATLLLFVSHPASAKSGATTTDYPDCGYRIVDVCKAWKAPNREERDREVRRLLSGYLTSEDQFVRRDALAFLRDYARKGEIDPRSFKSELEALDTLPDTRNEGKALLEQWAFERWPRADRERVYREALVNGSAIVGEAYEIGRGLAIGLAAHDGCSDLMDLMRMAHQMERGDDLGFEILMVLVDLRAGFGDTPEGNRGAVERLAATPTPRLYEHLRDQEAWREALARVASAVCSKDRDPGACHKASTVVRDVILFAQEEDRAHLNPFDRDNPNDPERLKRFQWYAGVKRGFEDCTSCELPAMGAKR